MGTPEGATPATGTTWVKLLRWSTTAAIVDVIAINLVAEVIPPLLVFGAIWIGSLVWLRRATKGPAILLPVSFVAFIVLSAPFTAKDIVFEQTTLQAEAGEVSVFVDNQDPTLHTFTIEELGVDLDVPASKSARVTFEAEPGEYEFFCEPHRTDMNGTLTVE